MKLRYFRLDDAWLPLLKGLGGWKEIANGVWSDGESVACLEESAPEPAIGFTYGMAGGTDADAVFTPSGLRISLHTSAGSRAQREGVGDSPFVLNHVSIRTPRIDEDHQWFRELLGAATVLSKSENRNPVDGSIAPEAHLCSGDSYYVTLRGANHIGIDHVGWMARRRSLVDDAHRLISGLGWQTVWGPGDLDGSYLVHFRGPDSRIHDFFYPTEELRAGAT